MDFAEQARMLYRQMMQEIDQCSKGMSVALHAECCFTICEKYRCKLRDATAEYYFRNINKEINFYKNIKPLFTSRLEYYRLIYQAEMFKPDNGDPVDITNFWQRQQMRLEKYVETTKDLYQYYKDQRTDKDAFYFVRKNNPLKATELQHENEMLSSTAVDRIIATFIALEEYKRYAEEQLELIAG